ncbi:MAG: hypothetical protein AAF799_29660 [Myxococcota bacterium]
MGAGCDPVEFEDSSPVTEEFRDGDAFPVVAETPALEASDDFCLAWDGQPVLIGIPWHSGAKRYLRAPNSEMAANLVTHEPRVLPDDGTHSFRWLVECDTDEHGGLFVRLRHGFGTNEYLTDYVDAQGNETVITRNYCEFPPKRRAVRFYVTPVPSTTDAYNITALGSSFQGWGSLRATLETDAHGRGYMKLVPHQQFDPNDQLFDFRFERHPDPVSSEG